MNFALYPAIDLREGRVVRLYQGDYAQETRYASDPVALAQQYEEAGATWLHVVDLDGARGESSGNLYVIEEIATQTAWQDTANFRMLLSSAASLIVPAAPKAVRKQLVYSSNVNATTGSGPTTSNANMVLRYTK